MGALSMDELNWALSELLEHPVRRVPARRWSTSTWPGPCPRTCCAATRRFRCSGWADELTVIITDPTNKQAVSELEAVTGTKVSIAIASRETLLHLLDRAFPGGKPTGRPPASATPRSAPARGRRSDPTGVAQVYALLLGALREDATEVHVEPLADEVRVRNRVEGRLVERARLPKALLSPVVARFRVLGGLRGRDRPPPEPRPHAPRAAGGRAGAAVLPDDPGRGGDGEDLRSAARARRRSRRSTSTAPPGTRSSG